MEKKEDVPWLPIAAIFAMMIGLAIFGFYTEYWTGPYRVTLYAGDHAQREWIVDNKPSQEGFGGGGYEFKDEKGNTIRVSGNVVIERVNKK